MARTSPASHQAGPELGADDLAAGSPYSGPAPNEAEPHRTTRWMIASIVIPGLAIVASALLPSLADRGERSVESTSVSDPPTVLQVTFQDGSEVQVSGSHHAVQETIDALEYTQWLDGQSPIETATYSGNLFLVAAATALIGHIELFARRKKAMTRKRHAWTTIAMYCCTTSSFVGAMGYATLHLLANMQQPVAGPAVALTSASLWLLSIAGSVMAFRAGADDA